MKNYLLLSVAVFFLLHSYAEASISESCSSVLKPLDPIRNSYSVSEDGKITFPPSGYKISPLTSGEYSFKPGWTQWIPHMDARNYLTQVKVNQEGAVQSITYEASHPPVGPSFVTAFFKYSGGRCYVEKIIDHTNPARPLLVASAPLCKELKPLIATTHPSSSVIQNILLSYNAVGPFPGLYGPNEHDPVSIAKFYNANCEANVAVSAALKNADINILLAQTSNKSPVSDRSESNR